MLVYQRVLKRTYEKMVAKDFQGKKSTPSLVFCHPKLGLKKFFIISSTETNAFRFFGLRASGYESDTWIVTMVGKKPLFNSGEKIAPNP